ncbi:hypothetical protein BT69DRAFT_1353850 [Atractiella rhizophila]|nr:hypothetical protein BT69DRAFT_1353850 [Atractiella rhizophila]
MSNPDFQVDLETSTHFVHRVLNGIYPTPMACIVSSSLRNLHMCHVVPNNDGYPGNLGLLEMMRQQKLRIVHYSNTSPTNDRGFLVPENIFPANIDTCDVYSISSVNGCRTSFTNRTCRGTIQVVPNITLRRCRSIKSYGILPIAPVLSWMLGLSSLNLITSLQRYMRTTLSLKGATSIWRFPFHSASTEIIQGSHPSDHLDLAQI